MSSPVYLISMQASQAKVKFNTIIYTSVLCRYKNTFILIHIKCNVPDVVTKCKCKLKQVYIIRPNYWTEKTPLANYLPIYMYQKQMSLNLNGSIIYVN